MTSSRLALASLMLASAGCQPRQAAPSTAAPGASASGQPAASAATCRPALLSAPVTIGTEGEFALGYAGVHVAASGRVIGRAFVSSEPGVLVTPDVPSPFHVRLRRHDPDGKALGPPLTLSSQPGYYTQLQIVASGERFFVVWESQTTEKGDRRTQLLGRWVGTDGSPGPAAYVADEARPAA